MGVTQCILLSDLSLAQDIFQTATRDENVVVENIHI